MIVGLGWQCICAEMLWLWQP